jgi:cell division initiation protein
MKITPLEIRQKSFEKAFRGVNKEEVNAFLLSLSHEWERAMDDHKDLQKRHDKLEKEVQKLRDVESTLYRTLKTAEDTGASVVEQANKTAELYMRETQINVEAMINDAKHQARAIIEKAESQAKDIIDEMNHEVKEMEENYRIIENQRDNVISQLRLLSGDVMSNVDKIRNQESGIETHLKKVKQMLRETSERVHYKAENVDFDKVEVKKSFVSESTYTKKAEVTREAPVAASTSKIDQDLVKKNFISEANPITRNPAPNPKKPEIKVKGSGLSFFDELED